MKLISLNLGKTLFVALIVCNVNAAELIIPHQFQPQTPAVSAEVNANFMAIKTSVDAKDAQLTTIEITLAEIQNNMLLLQTTISENQSTIASQQNTIATQEATIAALQGIISNIDADLNDQILMVSQMQSELSVIQDNTVLDLDGFLSLQSIDGLETAVFSSLNVQVDNGLGTESLNGLGNLYLGFNEMTADTTSFCLDPQFTFENACINGNSIWTSGIRTGSHNLILGKGHSYLSHGAMIGGKNNVSNGKQASVLSGEANVSSGIYSAIVSGIGNHAMGENSAILTGSSNVAVGNLSAVVAGQINTTKGLAAVVISGQFNQAEASRSSVVGGWQNKATGSYSVVSGGFTKTTVNSYGWRAGGLPEQ